ncbi:hypothetical protein CCACVL1_07780, partial [Corchorus capsularis]
IQGNWSWIWKFSTIPKIKHFIWLLNHQKIASKELFHRGISQTDKCLLCPNDTKFVDHIFRKCN